MARRAEIDIKPKSARFSQPWSMDGRGWITLPGDRNHWPREVSINDEPARVLERNGKPALLLEPGNYRIHGEIHWAKPPQSLPVAPATALIQLKRDGADIPVHVDSQGRLWLRERGRAENETRQNNTLKVEVFRLLSDDIPLRLDTELRLAVSGKPRKSSSASCCQTMPKSPVFTVRCQHGWKPMVVCAFRPALANGSSGSGRGFRTRPTVLP